MSRVNQWWSSISYLPAWGHPLRYFMSGTIGITAGIIMGADKPRIVWENIETAYADQTNKKIAVSALVLSENESERPNKKFSKADAMGAILGFVVHELAHFAFSPAKIPGLLNVGIPLNEFTASVANIVEDVFIEDAIVKREPTFGWMIKMEWDYLFTQEVAKERLEKWDGVSLVDIGAVLDVMCVWKNHNLDFTFRSELEENLYNLVMSVKGVYDLQQRKDLIEKIIHFLLDARKEETGEDLEEIMRQQGEELEKLQEFLKELLKELAAEAVDFSPEGELVDVKAKVRPVYGKSDALPDEREAEFENFSVAGNIIVSWLSPKGATRGKLTYDPKWKQFKQFAADQGTVRRVRGTAGMTGKLTHPANLNQNGKIFSNARMMAPNGSTGLEGAPQDIILIDCSGSMGGGTRNGLSKFEEALKAAQGATDGLVEAKHQVAVYGHTTGSIAPGVEGCTMYILKNFADGPDAAAQAIFNMNALGAQNSNADGFAIEAAGAKFVRNGSPMRLWVISDGQPACSMYAGDEGIRETKKAVDKLRKQGVEVYSFSIDYNAIEPNNRIYGVKNNFNAQDINVVRQVMKRFV